MAKELITPATADSSQTIWYASYSSNLGYPNAFQCYVEGGQRRGSDRVLRGCTDTTPPQSMQPVERPGSLYFAWESWNWQQGGAAFTETMPSTDRARALGRAYLLTLEQFVDVVAQENGVLSSQVPAIDLDRVRDGRAVSLFPDDPYSGVSWCGEMDGDPIVTFTAVPARQDYNIPSGPYMAMIARGLHEAHDYSIHQTAAYLAQAPGLQGKLSSNEVARRIDAASAI